MNKKQVIDAVRGMLEQHSRERVEFDLIDAAMRPWTPEQAAQRFGIGPAAKNRDRQIQIAQDSQALFLPLVLDTFAQSMKVENFFGGDRKQSSAWRFWQQNAMDAAQTGITRSTLQYGTSYAVVTKSPEGAPLISGVSPRQMTTYYGEAYSWPGEDGVSTEWPILALEVKGNRMRLFDEEHVYYLGAKTIPPHPGGWRESAWNSPNNLELIEPRAHGTGVPPVVRFRDRWLLDGEHQDGIVAPLLSLQNRIDRTSWEQGTAQYVAAFKQRYVIGWAPKDESDGMTMKASDVWFIDKPADKVKVGQFDETDLSGYIDSRQATVRDLAAIAQVPAQSLGANAISNISADGLAALESAKDRKASELETSLGESYEQVLRLCSHLDGDAEGASDFASEVKWADTTARSFAQTVDGLGKLATMLGVPAESLWEDVPGMTYERIQRIKAWIEDNPQAAATTIQFGGFPTN